MSTKVRLMSIGLNSTSSRRNSKGFRSNFIEYPENLENESLSSARGPSPTLPAVLVSPALDTSISDSCRPTNILPPHVHNLPTDTVSGRDADRDRVDGFKGSEFDSFSNFESGSPNVKEKLASFEDSVILLTDEEDVCPTCLEEYDAENPRITTKCQHHFHLSCILEWFERSNTCAICDRIMEIDNMALFDQTV